MIIRKALASDVDGIFAVLESEGDDWSCYWAEENRRNYTEALLNSLTYVAELDGEIVGYSRSLDDCGFYIYVCDLLVSKHYRGKGTGRQLMEALCRDFPDQEVFVMSESDIDDFYASRGYKKEGSIFKVECQGQQSILALDKRLTVLRRPLHVK